MWHIWRQEGAAGEAVGGPPDTGGRGQGQHLHPVAAIEAAHALARQDALEGMDTTAVDDWVVEAILHHQALGHNFQRHGKGRGHHTGECSRDKGPLQFGLLLKLLSYGLIGRDVKDLSRQNTKGGSQKAFVETWS